MNFRQIASQRIFFLLQFTLSFLFSYAYILVLLLKIVFLHPSVFQVVAFVQDVPSYFYAFLASVIQSTCIANYSLRDINDINDAK